MAFYIEREPSGPSDHASGRNDVSSPSEEVLARHGARVLRPTDPIPTVAGRIPRTTVYRSDTLLIPPRVLNQYREQIDAVLSDVNLRVEPVHTSGPEGSPVQVELVVLDPTKPAVIDAFVAVQKLNAAGVGLPDSEPEGGAAARSHTYDNIALEHILTGAVNIKGGPWDSGSVNLEDSYFRSPRGGPVPVNLAVAPPRQRRAVGKGFDRRPVVVSLDTGLAPHPWYAIRNRSNGVPHNGYIQVLEDVQAAIAASSKGPGRREVAPIVDYWDQPVVCNPLTGVIDSHVGHGLFIIGILRQIAPDARVGVARVLYGDGVAHEIDVLDALWTLVGRVDRAQRCNNAEDMVDILSFSLGYYEERDDAQRYTPKIAEVLAELTKRGVLVVAAAGNDATSRRFLPASLADQQLTGDPATRILSVGALNPNGTKALFSNHACWVRAWASGAAVVSTVPADVRGSFTPNVRVPGLNREGLDPDDFCSGFAVWHGTSFATPMAAAHLANEYIACAQRDPNLRLSKLDPASAMERARAAVQAWEVA